MSLLQRHFCQQIFISIPPQYEFIMDIRNRNCQSIISAKLDKTDYRYDDFKKDCFWPFFNWYCNDDVFVRKLELEHLNLRLIYRCLIYIGGILSADYDSRCLCFLFDIRVRIWFIVILVIWFVTTVFILIKFIIF